MGHQHLEKESAFCDGCGIFWIVNSITSTFIGSQNRKRQIEAGELDIQIQKELRELSFVKDEEIRKESLARERARLILNRKYRLIEQSKVFENQLKQVEIEKFIATLPIAKETIHLLIEQVKSFKGKEYEMPLNILLLHCLQSPYGPIDYRKVESKIDDLCKDISVNQDIKFLKGYCSANIEGNAQIMNLHTFMSQIPTVVVSPIFIEDEKKIQFNVGLWEPQGVRPLIKPVLQIDCDPALLKNDTNEKEYQKALQERVEVASQCIVGCMKDSYMLLTRCTQPVFPSLLATERYKGLSEKLRNNECQEITGFLKREYDAVGKFIKEKADDQMFETYGYENTHTIENLLQENYRNIVKLLA